MIYNYSVRYTISGEEGGFEKGILGVQYYKACNNSLLKAFIKQRVASKKKVLINIEEVENISEEESYRRFGNNLFLPQKRK
jgi:hypothetical protein